MTSTNINKIVQSNINLKPWMLSKKTNQIVNTCIQKIYKQMPASFNKSTKIAKVSTPRTENKGPLRTYKSQERNTTLNTITPTNGFVKRSTTKLKQQNNSLVQTLKNSNKNNQQMASKFAGANLMTNKRLLKSPNYKIYKSRRFGSSASSSRSSLFRRYDERRRQRQNFPTPINYLIRSFHTSQLEPTYARYLMPVRNQQLEANLGSIPDAIKISTNIQNDLMHIDAAMRCKVAKKSNLKQVERNRFDVWNHPPSLSRFRINSPKDSPIKNVSSSLERNMKRTRLTPEHREYARVNVQRMAQMKHPKPPNELFTAQHDRKKTELHEKHRRNRMKKLGLIESPSAPETENDECFGDSTRVFLRPIDPKLSELSESSHKAKRGLKHVSKSSPTLSNQGETTTSEKLQSNIHQSYENRINTKKENTKTLEPISKTIKPSTIPINKLPSLNLSAPNSNALPTISPIAAVRAQVQNKNSYPSYRYNRADFFSTKKY
ncbi:uncharacterized protein LOC119602175 [Lucilia sericata]|uniref:uncharacterized protein LOC119602175 n=1 Tax=Lucilia sericata TaxID=13632 RepID=UPI0018A87F41|nr:uncharacterized protein LOC119602175 [Lucilia sericata]